jgi:hypothetical protein
MNQGKIELGDLKVVIGEGTVLLWGILIGGN